MLVLDRHSHQPCFSPSPSSIAGQCLLTAPVLLLLSASIVSQRIHPARGYRLTISCLPPPISLAPGWSQVHLRLGDLNMVNGMYNEAADEFEKCLEHRLALPCRQSRGVADAHVRRAQALFYASTLEGADKVRVRMAARSRTCFLAGDVQ